MKFKYRSAVRSSRNALYRLFEYVNLNDVFARLDKSQIVFTYHNVIPNHLVGSRLSDNLSITPEQLRFHLEVISELREITTTPGTVNSAMITFDDGLKNNLTCALEVLDEFEIKAVFFVPLTTALMQRIPYQDRIFRFADFADNGTYELCYQCFQLHDQTSRSIEAKRLLNMVDGDRLLRDILDDDLKKYEAKISRNISKEYQYLRYSTLDESDLERLRSEGHLVAAHSANHERQTFLSSLERRLDFEKCASHIGSVYNCSMYAYPVGGLRDVTMSVLESCESANFSHAFINIPEKPFGETNYCLPRAFISPHEPDFVIKAKASGLDMKLRGIQQMLRRRKDGDYN